MKDAAEGSLGMTSPRVPAIEGEYSISIPWRRKPVRFRGVPGTRIVRNGETRYGGRSISSIFEPKYRGMGRRAGGQRWHSGGFFLRLWQSGSLSISVEIGIRITGAKFILAASWICCCCWCPDPEFLGGGFGACKGLGSCDGGNQQVVEKGKRRGQGRGGFVA